jgi:hypothetical protein
VLSKAVRSLVVLSKAVQVRYSRQFKCVYEGSRQFRCTNEAVQKTRPQYATQSSLGAVVREVQGRYCGKFKRTNEESTCGRNLRKFECPNEAI